MATIIGIESLMTAFFGLPKSVCTPLEDGCEVRSGDYDSLESGLKQIDKPEESAVEDFFHFFFIDFCDIGDSADFR